MSRYVTFDGARGLPGVVLFGVLIGVGNGFFLPASFAFLTEIQSHSPVELLSRVGSFVFFAFHGLMPLGTLLIGPVITATSPRLAATVSGALVLVLALAVLRSPSIRALHRTSPEPQAQPARSAVEGVG